MSKFRKVLSGLTSVAIASSMFTSLAVKAFDASISYADGKATATASGKLIAVRYDDNGIPAGIKMYDAIADTPVDVEVAEGDKLMLWNCVDGENAMTPLADVYTVEAAPEETEPPVEPTEPPVEPTEPPATGNKVYIDEPFTYDDQTIIASVGNDVEKAPNPVTIGSIVYAAGRRANAKEINNNAKISGNQLLISADSFATSERGVAFTFVSDAAIPTTADLAEGQVLEMSFDVTTSGTFEVSGYGELSTADLTTGAVHASIVLDKDAAMQYLIVTDANGTLINSKSAALTATTFTGMSFRVGSTTTYIDNLKVETKDKDAGVVTFSVKDSSDEAVEGAAIKINDNYSVTTGADGTATAALPNGTYTAEASKSGYEHTKGLADNDKKSITVASNSTAVDFVLSTMSYDKIPETVTIENGQAFIAAPKTAEPNKTAAFTVSVLDQYDLKVEPEEYTLSWAIYPAGSDTPDSNVTIDENGVVSVEQGFAADGGTAEYDVTATAVMNNEGLRGQTVKKTIIIGNNDVTYYEPVAWSVAGGSRSESTNLAQSVPLADTSSVTVTLNFGSFGNYTDNGRTFALVSPEGKVAGVQLTSAERVIKAFTGYNGTAAMNQYADLNNFTNSAVLVSAYEYGTDIDVTFVIDKVTNNVTVSCGDATASLPLTVIPSAISGLATGLYRYNCAFNVSKILVKEPDNNYLAISGDTDFAKVSGQTIERTYTLGQSVIVPEETFTWTVSPANQGVTVENGVLSVTDTATAGSYTLTATSDMNSEKTASVTVEIGDFQTIAAANATIVGAHALAGIGYTDTYSVLKLVDSYGDDVTKLLPEAVWSSDNEDVVYIYPSTGEATAMGYGTANVTATITNGTAVTTLTVPVTVAKYSITADATGDSTTVDTSNLITDSAITGYQVTTAKDGKMVKQEVVATVPTTVDTTGVDKLEISPVFTVTGLNSSNSKEVNIPAGTYNFNITGASGEHFDPYVNGQMLANNMLQGGTAVNHIAVNDIVVDEGYAVLTIKDLKAGTSASVESITIVRSPSIVDRVKKVYVLGDSLVCIYANGGDKDHNYQTGMGQVLQNYLTDDVEVVDLGNSGVIAEGLATSAITQVIESSMPGDIMLLESGYNDRSYTTKDKMLAAVKYMYEAAKENGVDVVLVSPPSSAHDYKADVAWTSVMKQAADETGAKYFDLAAASYKFFNDTYGDSFSDASVYSVYNVSDRLHSTFHGANKIASIMAGGMIDLGFSDIVNTDYVYTFNDNQSNTITCQATGTQRSSAEDVAKQAIAANGVTINGVSYTDVETLTIAF